MRRVAAGLVACVLAVLGLIGSALPARADGTTSIAHVETSSGHLQILVNVPPSAHVDLSSLTATLDGTTMSAAATSARTGTTVRRTAILAIDTSNSMAAQGRFTAAKQAAATYLRTVPADVRVGIVTFDSKVRVALAPTTDRTQAADVVDGLTLSRGTLLYDGLLTALNTAGETGQRSILLLSDGADTGSRSGAAAVTAKIRSTRALVDAVALGRNGGQLSVLRAVATAGQGRVVESTGSALTAAFRNAADVLASQILVTADVPADFTGHQGTVAVTLDSDQGSLAASALAPIEATPAGAQPESLPTAADAGGWDTPGWLLYAGIAVLAVGLVSCAVLLVPGKPAPMTIADRLSEYTARTGGASAAVDKAPSEPVLEQAKAAAAGVLERNQELDRRLTQRLSAAGSEFKPSEWLLLHFGVVVGAVLLGALIGRGNIFVALLFALLGVVGPMLYLRWKAGRRRKAFDNALPEVLSLMAGALSAGLSLPQSVDTIVREGPEPIAGEFKRVLVETRIGVPVEDAFEGVAARFNSKDFAWVVMAIRIQRQVGGNLAELLKTVAATMRERAYLRRQVNALAAEGKLSALILSLLPPGVAGFVMLTNGEYMTPMFHNLLGVLMLIGGVVWLAVGVFWMSRLVKVEI